MDLICGELLLVKLTAGELGPLNVSIKPLLLWIIFDELLLWWTVKVICLSGELFLMVFEVEALNFLYVIYVMWWTVYLTDSLHLWWTGFGQWFLVNFFFGELFYSLCFAYYLSDELFWKVANYVVSCFWSWMIMWWTVSS
jgi:hypothetical protein